MVTARARVYEKMGDTSEDLLLEPIILAKDDDLKKAWESVIHMAELLSHLRPQNATSLVGGVIELVPAEYDPLA